VDRSADIDVAARRIAWGKYLNAGQTCVAPDHVFVHADVHHHFVDALGKAVRTFYGDDPQQSADYARIVNQPHFDRLTGLLDGGGYDAVAVGGRRDAADRYLAPTVLTGVAPDAPVMGEEIFGPLLPVIAVSDLDEAIDRVNAGEKPLALYAFGASDATDRIVARTSSGGVGVNATIFHITVPELPFGGVGQSGMGAYHGRRSFDTFSHIKSVFERPTTPDPSVGYPPYGRIKQFILRRMFG
jgi:aldehyde dehydrogenase (NAD+)